MVGRRPHLFVASMILSFFIVELPQMSSSWSDVTIYDCTNGRGIFRINMSEAGLGSNSERLMAELEKTKRQVFEECYGPVEKYQPINLR
jgi:hypothetical protein